MSEFGCRTSDFECCISDMDIYKNRISKSTNRYLKIVVFFLKSKIQNPHSEIINPHSNSQDYLPNSFPKNIFISFHEALSAASLYSMGILNFFPVSVDAGLVKAWVASA